MEEGNVEGRLERVRAEIGKLKRAIGEVERKREEEEEEKTNMKSAGEKE